MTQLIIYASLNPLPMQGSKITRMTKSAGACCVRHVHEPCCLPAMVKVGIADFATATFHCADGVIYGL